MTRELTEADFQALADEAERGYCTELLDNDKPCFKPAVAEVGLPAGAPPSTEGSMLACAEHVKRWPPMLVRMLA